MRTWPSLDVAQLIERSTEPPMFRYRGLAALNLRQGAERTYRAVNIGLADLHRWAGASPDSAPEHDRLREMRGDDQHGTNQHGNDYGRSEGLRMHLSLHQTEK